MNIEAWTLTRILISFALILHSIELLRIQPECLKIWSFKNLEKEWRPFSAILKFFLSDRSFPVLIQTQTLLAISLLLYPSSLISGFLFLSVYLICLRFRGTLNGGSDTLTLIILFTLTLALSSFPILIKTGTYYLAVQITLSYFVAGMVKGINKEWWSGVALQSHLKTKVYSTPLFAQKVLSAPLISKTASWGIILFELAFPVVWVAPNVLPVFLSMAALFHLLNVYLFGLNRFFWVWIAGYPILWKGIQIAALNN